MTSHLDQLEARTIHMLREAYAKVKPLGMLWSIGKDSTALVWMARRAFFGRVPFPLIQLDTGMELDEVYAIRDRYVRDWNLTLHVEDCPPFDAMDQTLPPATRAAARKTEGLKNVIARGGYRGIIVGIRRDVVERDPWLPIELYKAFDRAKTAGVKRMFNPRVAPLAWWRHAMREQEELLGPDPWEYGLSERNRHTLETLIGYSHAHGMLKRKPSVDELFLDVSQGRKSGGHRI